jgi:hypothetical protein
MFLARSLPQPTAARRTGRAGNRTTCTGVEGYLDTERRRTTPMRLRPLRALLLAISATLAITAAAAAGGYATATLDTPPDDPTAGEPVEIGFTLLQHGVTPVTYGPTSLHVIDSATGDRTSFRATPSGPAGHWAAQVTFPSSGVYRFEISHDLEIQSINVAETMLSVSTASAVAGSAAGTSTRAGGSSALIWAIVIGATLLVGLILSFVLRPPRSKRTVAAAARPETT